MLLHVKRKNGVKMEKRNMQPDFNMHTKRFKPQNIQGQAIGGWSMGLRSRDKICRSKCKLHLYSLLHLSANSIFIRLYAKLVHIGPPKE